MLVCVHGHSSTGFQATAVLGSLSAKSQEEHLLAAQHPTFGCRTLSEMESMSSIELAIAASGHKHVHRPGTAEP